MKYTHEAPNVPKLAQIKHFEGKSHDTSVVAVFDASAWYLEYKNWFQRILETFLRNVQYFWKFTLA